MNVEIRLSEEDIKAIASKVLEMLMPYFAGNRGQNEADRLLTVSELAEYLGYSKQWIYNHQKILRPERINGKPLYRLSRIDTLLHSRGNHQGNNNEPIALNIGAFKQQKIK